MSEQKSYYDIDGEQYPRVTHILGILDKPGIARWRGRLGNSEADRVAKEGSDLGTRFHEVAAEINRGAHLKNFWRPPPDLEEMAQEYIRWLHKDVESIQGIEELVYSDEHVYAGTMDLYATIRGDDIPSIIDIKTSNNVGPDWPLQLSAYRKAALERGKPSKRRIIIRIPKVGKIVAERYEYTAHEADDKAWESALCAWRWMQQNDSRQREALVVTGYSL